MRRCSLAACLRVCGLLRLRLRLALRLPAALCCRAACREGGGQGAWRWVGSAVLACRRAGQRPAGQRSPERPRRKLACAAPAGPPHGRKLRAGWCHMPDCEGAAPRCACCSSRRFKLTCRLEANAGAGGPCSPSAYMFNPDRNAPSPHTHVAADSSPRHRSGPSAALDPLHPRASRPGPLAGRQAAQCGNRQPKVNCKQILSYQLAGLLGRGRGRQAIARRARKMAGHRGSASTGTWPAGPRASSPRPRCTAPLPPPAGRRCRAGVDEEMAHKCRPVNSAAGLQAHSRALAARMSRRGAACRHAPPRRRAESGARGLHIFWQPRQAVGAG